MFKFLFILLMSAATAGAFDVPKGAAEAALGLPDGYSVKVELARTPAEQEKGLMFRKELKEDRGMLFMFPDGDQKTFWMKNTLIELDIVFLDKDLKIGKIFHRVAPSRQGARDWDVARVSAPAFCVLELAGGAAGKHGLKPGSRLKISFPAAAKKK